MWGERGGERSGGARIYKPRVNGLANKQWALLRMPASIQGVYCILFKSVERNLGIALHPDVIFSTAAAEPARVSRPRFGWPKSLRMIRLG